MQLIDEEGFEGITIRKVAKRANVNVALINYYFGSKDKLLNAAVKNILNSLKTPMPYWKMPKWSRWNG